MFAAAISMCIALFIPVGMYRVLQTVLEGTVVRTQEEAAEACAALWEPGPLGSRSERVLNLGLVPILSVSLFVSVFVTSRLEQTRQLRKGLCDLRGILKQSE